MTSNLYIRRFLRNEDGAALVEYAVILGIILAVSVATLTAIGGDVSTIFTKLKTFMDAAAA